MSGMLDANAFAELVEAVVDRAERAKVSPILPRLLCELALRLGPAGTAAAVAAAEISRGLTPRAGAEVRAAELAAALAFTPGADR